MNKKRIVVSSVNIALSLGILVSLFLSIGFGGKFDELSLVRMSILAWTVITDFWHFLGALYFSVFTLTVIIASVSCIVEEVKNIVTKSSEYGLSAFSGLFFVVIYVFLALGIGELILWGWVWQFVIRLIGSVLLGNEVYLGFFGTGLFLFPVLIIAHMLFNLFVDDSRKEKKRKKSEAKEGSDSALNKAQGENLHFEEQPNQE